MATAKTIRIDDATMSPLECASRDDAMASREVIIDSPVGAVAVVLCPDCFALTQVSGHYRGSEVISSQEWIMVRDDQLYRTWSSQAGR